MLPRPPITLVILKSFDEDTKFMYRFKLLATESPDKGRFNIGPYPHPRPLLGGEWT